MKFHLFFILIIFLTACSVSNPPNTIKNKIVSSSQQPLPIKVLIVDGQNHHTVWPKSTVMLKQYLESSNLFSVDVYRTRLLWRGEEEQSYLAPYTPDDYQHLPKPQTDFTFNPIFNEYDVVISNFGYNAADWPINVQRSFEEYMRNGGGFVSIHSANNSFPNWKAYNEMTGLGGWGGRDENSGPYVYFSEEGGLVTDFSKGPGGAHGNKHEFQIKTRNEHPILAGLPNVWMHTKDECYGNLRGPAINMTVIASSLCPVSQGGTGKHEPALMVLTYRQGRIFHTTLGHQSESYESVGFITTFLRGAQWAATGMVTIPVPDDFPTEHQSSRRPFVRSTNL